jgi:hypothetical protein
MLVLQALEFITVFPLKKPQKRRFRHFGTSTTYPVSRQTPAQLMVFLVKIFTN